MVHLVMTTLYLEMKIAGEEGQSDEGAWKKVCQALMSETGDREQHLWRKSGKRVDFGGSPNEGGEKVASDKEKR